MGHWCGQHSSLSWERAFFTCTRYWVKLAWWPMTNPSIGIMKFRVIRSVWVRSDPVSKHKVFIRINTQNVVRDDAGLVKWRLSSPNIHIIHNIWTEQVVFIYLGIHTHTKAMIWKSNGSVYGQGWRRSDYLKSKKLRGRGQQDASVGKVMCEPVSLDWIPRIHTGAERSDSVILRPLCRSHACSRITL